MTDLLECFTDQCIETIVEKDKDGYGRIGIKGNKEGAHRLVYRIFKGEIPSEYVVMHTCDNPGCCNPRHLSLGTQKDNVQDSLRKNRRPQNSSHPIVRLNAADVLKIRTVDRNINSSVLSKKYGVTKQTIRNVKKGKTWPDVIGDAFTVLPLIKGGQ